MEQIVISIIVKQLDGGKYQASVLDRLGGVYFGTGKRARVAVRRALREWVKHG